MVSTSTTPYDADFFTRHRSDSRRSAQRLLQYVFRLVTPRSVVDIGCGVGTWLSVCWDHGITDILGIDGPWVDPQALYIPPRCFRCADLTVPLQLERTFDLVLSLEVAEHLPSEKAEIYVDTITRCGPVILFSAAIPGQGGIDHRNEQWPSYWLSLLTKRGFTAFDILRKYIWNDEAIEWWYRQNVLLIVSEEYLRSQPALHHALEAERIHTEVLPLVHPQKIKGILDEIASKKQDCATLRAELQKAQMIAARFSTEKSVLQRNLSSILSSQTYRSAVVARERLQKIPVLYPLARSVLRALLGL